jgi:hypothetical protein
MTNLAAGTSPAAGLDGRGGGLLIRKFLTTPKGTAPSPPIIDHLRRRYLDSVNFLMASLLKFCRNGKVPQHG